MRTVVVEDASRPRAPLRLVADQLAGVGGWTSLGGRQGARSAPVGWSFVATPAPLSGAWETATRLLDEVDGADLVVVGDTPTAGMLAALLQARPDPPLLVVVAGDGATLRWSATAGVLPSSGDVGAGIDWELVAVRSADLVVATSDNAARLLTDLGRTANVLPMVAEASRRPTEVVHTLRVATVSRRPVEPELTRWLMRATDLTEVSHLAGDVPDEVHSGTGWEASAGVRAVAPQEHLRDRRFARRVKGDAIIVPDPLAWPDDAAVEAAADGRPMIVRQGGPAASRWPAAARYADAAGLCAALRGEGEAGLPTSTGSLRVPEPTRQPERARRVSIAVPVFGDVSYLPACVASLLAQTEAVHEIILVDDGSASSEVDACLADLAAQHPGLVRVLRQANAGVCVARNLALGAVTGDAIVLVDQDDELAPTFVERTATVLRNRPDVIAVATWTEFFGTYSGVEAKPPFDARTGERENTIVSTCVLLDIAVIEAGIRFAPDLADLYCEDWDVWAQIVAAGGTFGLVPEPLARHRVHPSSGGHRRTELAAELGRARATAHLRRLDPTGALHRARGIS